MPTIPIYNQGATEEAGLTRAKRRVIKALESGLAQLTEKPAEDLTNGKADDIANMLIGQFEDLTSLFRQIIAYFGATDEQVYLDNPADAVKALKSVIITAKAISRIVRTTKALVPIIKFLDLGILSDLKSAQKECEEVATITFPTLQNINFEELDEDFSSIGSIQGEELDDDLESEASSLTLPSVVVSQPKQRRIDSIFQQIRRVGRELQSEKESDDSSSVSTLSSLSSSTGTTERKKRKEKVDKRISTLRAFEKLGVNTYYDLVTLMKDKYDQAIYDLEKAYATFNEFRKQKVFPAEAVAEETSQSVSGGVFRKPIYRVGNNVMSALYELDGLPRFI